MPRQKSLPYRWAKHLFERAAWFLTSVKGQNVDAGLSREFLKWVGKIG